MFMESGRRMDMEMARESEKNFEMFMEMGRQMDRKREGGKDFEMFMECGRGMGRERNKICGNSWKKEMISEYL